MGPLVILDGRQLVDTEYLMERFDASRATVCRYIAEGIIPAHVAKIGKSRLWDRATIDQLETFIPERGKWNRKAGMDADKDMYEGIL